VTGGIDHRAAIVRPKNPIQANIIAFAIGTVDLKIVAVAGEGIANAAMRWQIGD
jgi:hypothetical protein